MSSLPTSIRDINKILNSVQLNGLREGVQREFSSRISIVGPVNSGKSTLFNLIRDETVSAISPIPGTTKDVVVERVGPFILLDTPGLGEVSGGQRANITWSALSSSNIVVLVLDASGGVRQSDRDLLQEIKAAGKPFIVALNKIDLIEARLVEAVVLDAEARLGARVIPISAKEGTNVATKLIPAIISHQPELAVVIGRELPAYRQQAVRKIIREAALVNAAAGTEPVPMLDLPVLLATQVRMIMRLAGVYGEEMSVTHAKELITTIAGGLAFRYLAQESAKLVPSLGWAIAGGISGAGTIAIGMVAAKYFESGRHIKPAEMRKLYKSLLKQEKA
ncbi:MAG: GTP-binding protein [Chloroflexi bacterium]|nr:GTP-binding protein [Chloroflexota bacterium]